MWVKRISRHAWAVAAIGTAALSGCDIGTIVGTENRNVAVIDTNAYFYGRVDANGAIAQIYKSENSVYAPDTGNIVVDDDQLRYGYVFACPSDEEGFPHRVYFYFATVNEMDSIRHICRTGTANAKQGSIYGSIEAVDVNGRESVVLSTDSSGTTVRAYEAFAINANQGIRDIAGFKGVLANDGSETILPNMFLLSRFHRLLSEKPLPLPLSFNMQSSAASGIPADALKSVVLENAPVFGTSWDAEVGFRTENRTYLPLVKAQQAQFSFISVPRYRHDASGVIVSGAPRFRRDTEGHEFIARVYNGNQVLAELRDFFGDPVDKSYRFPAIQASGAAMSVAEDMALSMAWQPFQDDVLGNAKAYRWIIAGTPNDVVRNDPEQPIIDALEWHILVSDGWLRANGGAFQLRLPSMTAPTLTNANGDTILQWKPDWNFKAGTQTTWSLDSFTARLTDGSGEEVEAVAGFLNNGYFTPGLNYVKSTQYK